MPTELKANESNFHFFCGGIAPETFEVLKFKGDEEISEPYSLFLDLQSSNHNLNPSTIIGNTASFFMFRAGKYYPYSGIVRQFDYLSTSDGKSNYRALVVPRLLMLEFHYSTGLSRNMNYPDAIKKILDANGLANFYTMDLSQTYPVKEHIQQEGESDYNLITRLMAEAGIWIFFKEPPVNESQLKPGGSAEQLVITDKPSSFIPVDGRRELLFRGRTGMAAEDQNGAIESVSDVAWRQEPTPGEVVLKNYYSETPETKLMSRKQVSGGMGGTVYDYTTHNFKNVQEGDRAAEVEANRYISKQTLVTGQSDCRGFRAGMKFSIAEHPRGELNSMYVLLKMTFSGGHTGNTSTYGNTFEALPAALTATFAPQKTSLTPNYAGVKLAVVEANGSDYPLVDDQGRYKIRYCEDLSDAKNAEASKDVRMMQPMAGAKSGIQFPLREGTVVGVVFINGDPTRPLIVGAVPNASTVPPVTGSNKTSSVMRDAAGNEYLMDSEKGKEKVHLLTPAKNTVVLDDGEQRACLQSKSQDHFLLDDKNTRTELSRGKHTIVMSAKSGEEGIVITTAGGHVIRVDDKKKSITIQSAGGGSIQIDDDKKSIVMTDPGKKSTVTLDGDGIAFNSKGKISITAAQELTIDAKAIAIKSSGAIDLNAQKEISLKGMGITEDAGVGDVAIKGNNIALAGTLNASMEGKVSAELKSTAGAKVSGMKVDVNGTAMTSMSGLVVKVN